MRAGFIGLGRMGSQMARHILEAGYDLTVHDIRKAAAEPLLEKGAKWAETPRDVAETCEVVLSSLPSPAEVREVVYGADGLMSEWKDGDIYVDMSTSSLDLIRQVAADAAKKGVCVLDAPVTGGTEGAEKGTLVIIVGGDKTAAGKVEGVFRAMGTRIYHAGEVGSGTIAKLVNNVISLTSNAIMAEAFVLGVKAGVDPEILWQVASTGTANNWDLQRYPQLVLKGNFEPGFRLSLGCKDVGLAVQLGRECGVPLPVAAAVEQSFLRAQTAGLGDKSVYAIIQNLEQLVGVEVRSTEKKKITGK
jgi:3-hydroxyisobutyrate dehydrogenase-like beta-hydroxyacid dehydrogenase